MSIFACNLHEDTVVVFQGGVGSKQGFGKAFCPLCVAKDEIVALKREALSTEVSLGLARSIPRTR
jgi:hypothetical protein